MGRLISEKYAAWQAECEERFQQLKKNEEELNRIFIDIYGLQDELTPDVADKDVTVHRVFTSHDDVPESMKGSNYVRTMRDEIVSLISYAVGCMFGRYSLDVEGLAYAGGEWDGSKYKTFLPDEDNCIPVTDEEYFKDDIVGRFVEFVRTVYGSDTLEENLAMRKYFRKEFQNHGFIRFHKRRELAEELIEEFDIRSSEGAKSTARSMSGGNQQKAIIAREIDSDENVILAMQPTRGLDVGAIENIHKNLLRQRDAGKAVLLVSFDLEEVMNISDRIIVFYEGEIVADVRPEEVTVNELGLYMSGSKRKGAVK